MHLASRRASCRVGSLLLSLVIGLTSLASFPATAAAEPTSEERRVVATEVADSFCRNFPSLAGLPKSADPRTVCRSVLVENLDPEGSNDGVRAACLAALPLTAKPASLLCAQAVDRLLDPARAVFLDRVVPAVQQLACVASAPAAFDCLAQQVHVWLKQSIVSLWQGLVAVLTADTEAIKIIDGWRNAGMVSLYEDVGSLAALVLLGLMITSLIISIVRFDFRHFGSTLLGVVMWGMFWASGVTIAVLLIKASDGAARWLAGTPDSPGRTDLDRAGAEFGRWVDYITGAPAPGMGMAAPTYQTGSMTGLLVCMLLVVAIVVAIVTLLMRNIALLLLVVSLPLTLAGSAGPAITRSWLNAAIRLFVALLLAKPLIVIAVRLGATLVTVPRAGEPQATFTDALLGVAIILLAGLLPGVIYRFSGGLMATQAGTAPRASGGFSEQSGHAATSAADSAWALAQLNPMPPLTVKPSTGLGAGAGSSASAGAGLRAVPAAAGPLGAAVAAGSMIGGAVESGGRWLAGQAATAGGVLGDVEAPRIPAPPVSRYGRHGTSAPGSVSGHAPAPPAPDHPGRSGGDTGSVTLTITPDRPGHQQNPQLPNPAPPLVITGQVEPDTTASVLPEPPRALPPGERDPS
jgi:hypothetical protein